MENSRLSQGEEVRTFEKKIIAENAKQTPQTSQRNAGLAIPPRRRTLRLATQD